MVISKAVSF